MERWKNHHKLLYTIKRVSKEKITYSESVSKVTIALIAFKMVKFFLSETVPFKSSKKYKSINENRPPAYGEVVQRILY